MTIQEFHQRLESANDAETEAYAALASSLSWAAEPPVDAAAWAIWSE